MEEEKKEEEKKEEDDDALTLIAVHRARRAGIPLDDVLYRASNERRDNTRREGNALTDAPQDETRRDGTRAEINHGGDIIPAPA